MNDKYSIEQIKNKFKKQMAHNDIEIPSDEYDLFCNALTYVPQDIRENEANVLYPLQIILHEIAHHVLGHFDPINSAGRKAFEKAADELANEWLIGN